MKNYAVQFEAHIGRRLKKWEADIIMPLERLRILRRDCHVVILDPVGRDSRPLLLDYLRWLINKVNPWVVRVLHGA